MMSGHLGRLRVVQHHRHCYQRMFHGLVGRQMLGAFLGGFLVLKVDFRLAERLLLASVFLGYFW